jgi:hypothetical protein
VLTIPGPDHTLAGKKQQREAQRRLEESRKLTRSAKAHSSKAHSSKGAERTSDKTRLLSQLSFGKGVLSGCSSKRLLASLGAPRPSVHPTLSARDSDKSLDGLGSVRSRNASDQSDDASSVAGGETTPHTPHAHTAAHTTPHTTISFAEQLRKERSEKDLAARNAELNAEKASKLADDDGADPPPSPPAEPPVAADGTRCGQFAVGGGVGADSPAGSPTTGVGSAWGARQAEAEADALRLLAHAERSDDAASGGRRASRV